jgi:hypothetical protein
LQELVYYKDSEVDAAGREVQIEEGPRPVMLQAAARGETLDERHHPGLTAKPSPSPIRLEKRGRMGSLRNSGYMKRKYSMAMLIDHCSLIIVQ